MTCHILLIDDSEHDQLAHQRALRVFEYTVETAPTIAAGLAKVQQHVPHVIMLDYNLPDGNGLDFMLRLTELGIDPMPPIVMITGSGNEGIAVAAMRAGASDYLIKDMSGGHLRLLPAVVERALREHDARIAKREAERQLQLAANVYYNITEGILATDPKGNIVSVNPALCAITGYTAEELINRNPKVFKSNRHDHGFYQLMWSSITQNGCWQGEVWNRRKNGSLFLVRETITALRDSQGRLQNYAAVLIDITEAKQTEAIIRHQAYHDPLTNLPNRALFMDRMWHQLAHCRRNQTSMGILFIDLDGFKQVNDELGHDFGDDLLKEAARRLAACARESDTVARLGGDEFTAIIIDMAGPEDAAKVARKMLEEMRRPFLLKTTQRSISASIGIAVYPDVGDDAVGLLNAADAAMFSVKRRGKSDFDFAASPHMADDRRTAQP